MKRCRNAAIGIALVSGVLGADAVVAGLVRERALVGWVGFATALPPGRG